MDLTREQLYEMLWTDGVGKTEKALGLKQQELQRICQDYAIPKPSSAYWYGILYEKNPQKTPLPASEKEGPIHTEDYLKKRRVKQEKPVVVTPVAPPEETKESAPVKPPKGKYPPRELPPEEPPTVYTVPEKLYAKDPLILDTKARLREENSRRDNPWYKKNPYKNTPDKWLDIKVYREQEDRALRVFQSIWRAAEAKGYHMEIKVDKGDYRTDCKTYFIVREHHIRVQLKEINQRTKDESRSWSSSMWTGTGRLKFLCNREVSTHSWSYYNNERVATQDTEHSRIEDKIERIIEVLEEIADKRDQAEVERKLAEERRKIEEELERQEEERKRQEAERLAKIEARRDEERDLVRKLLFNADRAHVAALIREYASQFETAMAGKMDEEEFQRQLQWMREKADYIDPFIKRDDEWLLPSDISKLLNPEIIKYSEDRHSSYSYGPETVKSYWQIKNSWWNRR